MPYKSRLTGAHQPFTSKVRFRINSSVSCGMAMAQRKHCQLSALVSCVATTIFGQEELFGRTNNNRLTPAANVRIIVGVWVRLIVGYIPLCCWLVIPNLSWVIFDNANIWLLIILCSYRQRPTYWRWLVITPASLSNCNQSKDSFTLISWILAVFEGKSSATIDLNKRELVEVPCRSVNYVEQPPMQPLGVCGGTFQELTFWVGSFRLPIFLILIICLCFSSFSVSPFCL